MWDTVTSTAGILLGSFSILKTEVIISPKRRFTFNALHVVLSHDTVLFITTAVGTSNPNRYVIVKVILRPTVSRPVCPGVRRPSGTRDQFFFLLQIFFRQLRVCYFVAPSLTRGRVCNLLLLLVSPVQSLSGLSPTRLKTIFYYPNFLDFPNLEGQVPVFISPRNRVAQLYPGHWVPFLSPLTARRAAVEVF
jgi:hypothetical protein